MASSPVPPSRPPLRRGSARKPIGGARNRRAVLKFSEDRYDPSSPPPQAGRRTHAGRHHDGAADDPERPEHESPRHARAAHLRNDDARRRRGELPGVRRPGGRAGGVPPVEPRGRAGRPHPVGARRGRRHHHQPGRLFVHVGGHGRRLQALRWPHHRGARLQHSRAGRTAPELETLVRRDGGHLRPRSVRLHRRHAGGAAAARQAAGQHAGGDPHRAALTVQPPTTRIPSFVAGAVEIAPGLALSAIVALAGYAIAALLPPALPLPAMVMTLFVGMALNRIARHEIVQPGARFCVRVLLRWGVALLGVRVGLGDIADLGVTTAILVVLSMGVTIASGFVFARRNGQAMGFGALAGAATAVCGASAALATSTVLPNYPGKDSDLVFVIMGVNALATLALVVFPLVCVFLDFDAQTTGVMLGGTIHDVAQVVGAGYAVSEPVGNTAVIVKLFRVLLMLPVVLGIGWYFTSRGVEHGKAKVPVPVFALGFVALCALNSAIAMMPAPVPLYQPVRALLIQFSTWALLIAIGALGLGTSLSSFAAVGWRHGATLLGTTAVIFVAVTGGLLVLRMF